MMGASRSNCRRAGAVGEVPPEIVAFGEQIGRTLDASATRLIWWMFFFAVTQVLADTLLFWIFLKP